MMKLLTSLTLLLAVLPLAASFAPVSPYSRSPWLQQQHSCATTLASVSESSQSSVAQQPDEDGSVDEEWRWNEWANENGVTMNAKISVRPPLMDERGKGGVEAVESIAALEVLARIPRDLIVAATSDMPAKAVKAAAEATSFSWATDLTAATLVAMHPSTSGGTAAAAKQSWITNGWKAGGWATDPADLGPPDAGFGPKYVTGTLLATGSDNDHNIYAKFRFPCHPVVHRAAIGLALLTESEESDAREALTCRGRAYRSMRDALLPLVETPTEIRKGSLRERRAWDVSDILSRVLSRTTTLSLDDEDQPTVCIVPLHDRLAHSSAENSKLVCSSDDEILLVATRDIAVGEAITRNYGAAPQLEEDKSDGAMRLLLQFGLPPKAWTA